MTAVQTPAIAGARAHRRRLRRTGAMVAALVAIGAALVLPTINGASGNASIDLNCDNVGEVYMQAVADIKTVLDDRDLSDNEKHEQLPVLREKRDEAKAKNGECQKEAEESPDSDTTTTAPPTDTSQCNGVNYAPYKVRGTNRFGPEPVAVASANDLDKVVQAWDGQLDTNPFHTAAMRQGRYLVEDGIRTDGVQAAATHYQSNPDDWANANQDLRNRLNRARLELVKVSGVYHTQEALVVGNDPCAAPAAKDVTSQGDRWVLRVHLSAQDGGRTIDLVVFCNFQIHEQAQPGTTVTPTTPTTTPATVTTTAPPVVTTAPPTTQPEATTTTTSTPQVTTTTAPPKPCTEDPGKVTKDLPLCIGTPRR